MINKEFVRKLLRPIGLNIISTERTGISIFNEIQRTKVNIDVVLDVGANVGDTSRDYLREFPKACVHAFEPVGENFRQLEQLTSSNLQINKLAVGATTGKTKIYLSKNPVKHSTVVIENENNFEYVDKTTVDLYCNANNIERIGLLKIDTEGGDLKVLAGAEKCLAENRIDFILVETAFYKKQRHVNICDFISFLSKYNYHVFGIYDQWFARGGRAHIEFANALFTRNGIMVST